MKNKYYTPTIDEFYVGFECEFKNNMQSNIWEKEVCDVDTISIVYDYIEHESIDDKFEDAFRVKYLDKEDIESLGWEGQKANSVYFKKGKYRLVHWLSDNEIGRDVSIYESYDGGTQEEALIRKAIIKNKSELKKLLKQLGIND